MPDQHDILGAGGIDQRRHIVHKMRQSVVCDLRGTGGAPVSALIDRPDAIAHSCQHRYLVPPGDGVLRKAVQTERQPVSGALLEHLEAQPVGLNELGLHIRYPATLLPNPILLARIAFRCCATSPSSGLALKQKLAHSRPKVRGKRSDLGFSAPSLTSTSCAA